MRHSMTHLAILFFSGLLLVLAAGCNRGPGPATEVPSPEPEPQAEEASWRAPEIDQFREAYEWGSEQGTSDIAVYWLVCADRSSGLTVVFAQEVSRSGTATTDCAEGALIFTPLAVTAAVSQLLAAGLPEDELLDIYRTEHEQGTVVTSLYAALQVAPDFTDLQELLTDELTVFCRYEGSIWDLDYQHVAQITQGERVINSFSDRVTYHGEVGGVIFEARFKIGTLDPTQEFWCTVTQEQGERRFLFRIDPDALGPGEFF